MFCYIELTLVRMRGQRYE